jgi:cobalt-zinc-cadmium efflux system protein
MMSAGHSHAHGVIGHRRALIAVLLISTAVLVAEVIGGVLSGSLALIADAGHMFADVAGLSLAVVAAVLVERPATARRTWGYRRAEVLAAAAQAAVLLAVSVFVVAEAVSRLVSPTAVEPDIMVIFGAVALFANIASIVLLSRARGGGLNVRAAMLEVMSDALGAAAVIVAAALIAWTGWARTDAVVSLVIGALILPRTWKLLRDTVGVLMEAAPKGVDLAAVRDHILGVEHVRGLHDLHASSVASDLPILTAHVVVDDSCFHDGHLPRLLDELQDCLAGHFDVEHSTFQFEPTTHAEHEHAAHA